MVPSQICDISKFPSVTSHPVFFQKTSAAPFGNKSPQLRGAWSAHDQTCKISREKLPHPLKLRQDELIKRNFFVSLPLCEGSSFLQTPVLNGGGPILSEICRVALILKFEQLFSTLKETSNPIFEKNLENFNAFLS